MNVSTKIFIKFVHFTPYFHREGYIEYFNNKIIAFGGDTGFIEYTSSQGAIHKLRNAYFDQKYPVPPYLVMVS